MDEAKWILTHEPHVAPRSRLYEFPNRADAMQKVIDYATEDRAAGRVVTYTVCNARGHEPPFSGIDVPPIRDRYTDWE